LRAVELTVLDAVHQSTSAAAFVDPTVAPSAIRIGGLRSGRLVLRGGDLRLDRYSYVPGVSLSLKTKKGKDRLSVTGPKAARGKLTISDDRIRGRLGGVRVNRSFVADLLSAVEDLEVSSARSRPRTFYRCCELIR
jgi:hypothetical protein